MTNPIISIGSERVYRFFIPCQGRAKEQRGTLSALATELVSALGSVSTGALSSAQAK